MLRWIAPWAVLAAILGFALGGSFAWCLLDSPLEGNHQSESYDSAKHDNRAANGERGTARNPLVVEIAPTPESQSKSRENARDEQAKANRERHLVIATYAIAVVTTVLAFGTGLLAAYTFNLWRSTGDLVKGAEDTAVRQLRAYVSFIGVRPEISPTQTPQVYEWRLRPIMKNSGQTPTANLRIYVDVVVSNIPMPKGFDFSQINHDAAFGHMGPNSDSAAPAGPHPTQPAISANDVVLHQIGQKYIYLWGWVRYADVFDATRAHVTRFCWQITLSGSPFILAANSPVPVLSANLALHPEGNCADDECVARGMPLPPI